LTARPILFVLAGVNGAGKSSIGGGLLRAAGLPWFNPDEFARAVRDRIGCPQEEANGIAWNEGLRRLRDALAAPRPHAFETTLGGSTLPRVLREATASHDVRIWYCGLDSPERHIARVKLRVAHGGHDIPEDKIRSRYRTSLANLISLVPHVGAIMAYDNSRDVAPGEAIPDPRLVADIRSGRLAWPTATRDLAATPAWAKPLLALL
jgi:predicted ABC-type ATPase